MSTCSIHKRGISFQGVLLVLGVAEWSVTQRYYLSRTLARLGDLLKALERLVSVEADSSGHCKQVWGESLVGTTCVVPGPSLYHLCV